MTNPKLLVIDDDPMTCRLIEMVLQMEDYRTTSVNYIGEEGIIAILNNEEPDMVILDIHLGSKETLEELRAIRASRNWRNLPILMTSAIDRRQASLQAGANDFILKPFDWQVLLERVNKMRDNFIYQEV